MKHLLRILSLLLPLTAAAQPAQSVLPPCPTDVSVRWHQCFGTFADKSERYVGEFRNDRYHGQGTYYFPSGATYAGEFRDGVRHGRGAYTFANGVKFVGEYQDGKREGLGIEYGPDGSVTRSGQWSDGNLTQAFALSTQRFPFSSSPRPTAASPADPSRAERDRLLAEAQSERQRRVQLEAQLEAERRKRLEAENRRGSEQAPSTGTGFLVAPGLLITNHHVAANCQRLDIVSPDGRRAAKLVDADDLVDLALVRVTGLTGPVASIRRAGSIRLGEAAYAFGFPLTGLLSEGGNFTNGVVSSLRGMRDSVNQIQITTPVQPGNSGGALVDSAGGVIGVVAAKLNAAAVSRATGDIPQNVNFAVSPQALADFLRKNAIATRAVERGAALDTAQLADTLRGFTHRVECSGPPSASPAQRAAEPSAAPASGNTAVWLINRSGESIFRVFVSATSANNWGTDQLGSSVIANGDRFIVEPAAALGCVFDVRVEYKSGAFEEKRQQDFCVLDELAFSGEGRRTAASTTAANWILVATSSADNEFYVDPASIQRDGDYRRFWRLLNLKVPLDSGASSFRIFREIDCRQKRGRNLQWTSFRGPKASGEVALSNTESSAWEFIAPDAVTNTELRYVCAR
jgi:S1-C subfamily serine protease